MKITPSRPGVLSEGGTKEHVCVGLRGCALVMR